MYYDTFILKNKEDASCLHCKIPLKLYGLSGYGKYCSRSCASIHDYQINEKRRLACTTNIKASGGRPKESKNKKPYPRSPAVLQRFLTNKPPTWAGKQHSAATKLKMKTSRLKWMNSGGKIVGSYKGKYAPKNPDKYAGDVKNIIYRSSWELRLMSQFDNDVNVVTWSSEEYKIPYISPIDKKQHVYYPDFLIKTKNGDTILIEVKPKFQTQPPQKTPGKTKKRYIREVFDFGKNIAKWEAAEKACKINKWKFQILTEDHLKSLLVWR